MRMRQRTNQKRNEEKRKREALLYKRANFQNQKAKKSNESHRNFEYHRTRNINQKGRVAYGRYVGISAYM